MEKKEYQLNPNISEQFDKLPFNSHIELPMSMLTPITIDDYKEAKTIGPLNVFRKNNKIYIDDGNHRFFKKVRELLAENNYKEPDLNKTTMEVKKIDPTKAINSWMLEY